MRISLLCNSKATLNCENRVCILHIFILRRQCFTHVKQNGKETVITHGKIRTGSV